MATKIPIQEIRVGDAGLDFETTIMDADGVVPLANATLMEFWFQRPDGTHFAVPANYVTDGTDGKIKYVTTPTTFDEPGLWRHQAYVEIGPDQKRSSIHQFRVYPNIPLG